MSHTPKSSDVAVHDRLYPACPYCNFEPHIREFMDLKAGDSRSITCSYCKKKYKVSAYYGILYDSHGKDVTV